MSTLYDICIIARLGHHRVCDDGVMCQDDNRNTGGRQNIVIVELYNDNATDIIYQSYITNSVSNIIDQHLSYINKIHLIYKQIDISVRMQNKDTVSFYFSKSALSTGFI